MVGSPLAQSTEPKDTKPIKVGVLSAVKRPPPLSPSQAPEYFAIFLSHLPAATILFLLKISPIIDTPLSEISR